jgi:hypothetical protein
LAGSELVIAEELDTNSAAKDQYTSMEYVVAVGRIFEGQMKAMQVQRNSNRISNTIYADSMGNCTIEMPRAVNSCPHRVTNWPDGR